jgi:ADP-ribosyl-[dinitrogen reductase] hydrolase
LPSPCRAALYGLFIGDALAMPVHWYYNRSALMHDYGLVTDYLAPRNPHPDSILWRSSYQSHNEKGEILHEQAQYWGRRGIHYHQFLKAGENTLNLKLCALLVESLNEKGRYDAEDYLQRYVDFMTTPGRHRDTYIEECHRNFFSRYARGVPPRKCGIEEKHIGGLAGIVPIVVFYRNHPELARQAAWEHLSLTHPGIKMKKAASLVADLLLEVLGGKPLRTALLDGFARQESSFWGHPFDKWLTKPVELVVGGRLSTACYVEDSIPAVIYLALKYHQDVQKGLIANTNLGGDNAHRGAVLGALLGVSNGMEAFPEHWIRGLLLPPPELKGCVS